MSALLNAELMETFDGAVGHQDSWMMNPDAIAKPATAIKYSELLASPGNG